MIFDFRVAIWTKHVLGKKLLLFTVYYYCEFSLLDLFVGMVNYVYVIYAMPTWNDLLVSLFVVVFLPFIVCVLLSFFLFSFGRKWN